MKKRYLMHSFSSRYSSKNGGRRLSRVRCSLVRQDEVAEWLRRWSVNPMDSVRVGSNPIHVVNFVGNNNICRRVAEI